MLCVCCAQVHNDMPYLVSCALCALALQTSCRRPCLCYLLISCTARTDVHTLTISTRRQSIELLKQHAVTCHDMYRDAFKSLRPVCIRCDERCHHGAM